MKKIVLIIALFISVWSLQAQDQAIFSHYTINPILINPAFAGFNESHNLMLNLRNQSTGFPGAPRTYSLGYNGPIGKTLGVGANLLSENIASITRLRFQLNYAFRYQVRNVKFAGGFSTDFSSLNVANSVFDNPRVDPNDAVLADYVAGVNVFDASLGGYATFSENTFVGLTFPNLIVARISDIASNEPEGEFFKYYIFNAGHKFVLDEYNFTIQPSLMLRRINNVPFQVDFNLNSTFLDDKLIAGLSYRTGTGGQVGLLLGTSVTSFQFYYSYDISFQRFQQYNSGSHEVTVAFSFDKKDTSKGAQKRYRD